MCLVVIIDIWPLNILSWLSVRNCPGTAWDNPRKVQMPVLWNGSPVYLIAFLSLPHTHPTHTLCVWGAIHPHCSFLFSPVVSGPPSVTLILGTCGHTKEICCCYCVSQRRCMDRKELTKGLGSERWVLKHSSISKRRLAKNIWELFPNYGNDHMEWLKNLH